MIIVSIVASCLCLVLIAIVLFLLAKSRKPSPESIKTSEYFGEIKSALQSGKDSMPLIIAGELSKQMVGIQKQLSDQAEADHRRLGDFQSAMSKSLADSLKQMNDSLNLRVDAMSDSLSKSVAALNEKVDQNLAQMNKQVGETLVSGFKGTSDAMGELKEKLAKIDEAQKHLESLQNDVVSLNNILANNQARGQYGELQLEMLLEATFPGGKGKFYNIQDDLGRVKDGEKIRPDADIVFTVGEETTKLCIDSKFPFADYARLFSGESISDEERRGLKVSFRNAVRNQAQSIGGKYIIPGLTMKYAIMFVPNDGVFAYIENEFPDVVSEARANGVIIAAPSTLQAIIVVFHSAALDAERNKDLAAIDAALKSLGDEFGRFSERWNALAKSIDTVTKKTKDFNVTVEKIATRFERISRNELKAEAADSQHPALASEGEASENAAIAPPGSLSGTK